ncbi:Uncharacterised protein [Neisseria subflava]|uniref:Uncharacterized protein n=1 Tax=Neisseria subflava TaxID=28449 RepID=A0A9X9QZQ1_NEISU|nr:Uncharacterised protein [Neisseria subflava]
MKSIPAALSFLNLAQGRLKNLKTLPSGQICQPVDFIGQSRRQLTVKERRGFDALLKGHPHRAVIGVFFVVRNLEICHHAIWHAAVNRVD